MDHLEDRKRNVDEWKMFEREVGFVRIQHKIYLNLMHEIYVCIIVSLYNTQGGGSPTWASADFFRTTYVRKLVWKQNVPLGNEIMVQQTLFSQLYFYKRSI